MGDVRSTAVFVTSHNTKHKHTPQLHSKWRCHFSGGRRRCATFTFKGLCDAVQRFNIYIFVNLTQYIFFSPSVYSGTLRKIWMRHFLTRLESLKSWPFCVPYFMPVAASGFLIFLYFTKPKKS